MSVQQPSQTQVDAAKAWALPMALVGGTNAMRKAETQFLPQEEAESEKAYHNRLKRTYLFNGFAKTVEDLTGKVFAKPLVLQGDVPTQIRGVYDAEGKKVVTPGYAENIDLTGRHLNNFACDVFKAGMQTGIEYVFVDMPPAIEDATRKQEQDAGVRPYMVHVRPQNLLGWQARSIGGVMTLTQVRMYEVTAEIDPDDRFQEIDVERVRVVNYDPGVGVTWELYRKPEGKESEEWVLEDTGTMSVSRIPLVPIYLNRVDFMRGECPLRDLADLNLAHWQSTSDQRNILHVARVPILFASGFGEDDSLVVGANSFTASSNEAAKLTYVEHSGSAIGSGRDDLKDLEFQMQVFGLQLMIPRPNGQTATGEVIDEARMTSALAMMADSFKDGFELALGFMAEFDGLGMDAGGSIQVNKDYGVSLRNAEDIKSLIAMVNANLISRETFWSEMKRRGFLPEDFNGKDEADRIADNPALGGMMDLPKPKPTVVDANANGE